MSRPRSAEIGESPFFRRPSGASLPRLGRWLIVSLLHCVEIYRQRRALEALDERMLKDIGVSRCDVEAEIERPLWR